MLSIKIDVQGLDKLEKHIEFVQKMAKMKTDKSFQKFIQQKVLDTVNKITEERLVGGTTNDSAIPLYKESNKIREYDQGFILYNDASIMANAKDTSGYPNGEFSVALAFEYGVGIIGQNTPNNNGAWAYNINNYNFGWWFKSEEDDEYYETAGYMGFEIYRYTAIECQKEMKKWVEEYYKGEVL